MLPLAPPEIPLTFLLGSRDCLSQGWFIYFLQFLVSGQDCSVGWPGKVMVGQERHMGRVLGGGITRQLERKK